MSAPPSPESETLLAKIMDAVDGQEGSAADLYNSAFTVLVIAFRQLDEHTQESLLRVMPDRVRLRCERMDALERARAEDVGALN